MSCTIACMAREVLKQGIIRRIGAGEGTKIWDMNWLPRDGLLKPLCCIGDNPPQVVSQLIDPTSTSWDRQKLQQYFTPMDIDVIANIALSTDGTEDFWAWHYEQTGVFSVRSAYRMLIHRQEVTEPWTQQIPGRSNTAAVKKEWTNLWKV